LADTEPAQAFPTPSNSVYDYLLRSTFFFSLGRLFAFVKP